MVKRRSNLEGGFLKNRELPFVLGRRCDLKKLMWALAALSITLGITDAFGEGLDEYTVLLLHFNGEDGSTNFVDSSYGNHIVTANGNVQFDTAQSKFGSASCVFDGNGDYLTFPDSEDWNFGNRDFTIDFWVRFNVLDNSAFWRNWTNGSNFLSFYWAGNWYLQKGGGTEFVLSWPDILSTNTWYHIALVRSGNNYYVFRDGVSLETRTDSTAYVNYTDVSAIGCLTAPSQFNFNGWLDEFRISKDIARWTSNFTPPTFEYSGIPNEPPLANAGTDVEALVGEEVTLDGTYSSDPDGTIVLWVWRNLSDLQKPIVAEGKIAAIKAHGYAEELIELTVKDNRGAVSTDTMKITNPGIEGPPGPKGEQGEPGIAPEEVDSMQDKITELQQENRRLKDLLDKVISFPSIENWLKNH